MYKIDDLTKRIFNTNDTTYIVNFWATWCKPCVSELPEFEKLHQGSKGKQIKVLLVSMDFKEELDKKLKNFLEKINTHAKLYYLMKSMVMILLIKYPKAGVELFLPH